MHEPARFPRIQHEAVVRLLAADLVGEQPVLESLRGLRAEFADLPERLDAPKRSRRRFRTERELG